MKKIFSIISAGVALLLAASCTMKEDLVVLDPSQCTAPVVNSYEATEDGILVNFTPGVLNVNAPVYHALVLTNVGGTVVNVPLNSIEKDGVLSITPQSLSSTLLGYGYADGDVVSVELLVRASAQQKQTGNHSGYVDSAERISVADFEVVVPKGSPYGDYTEASEWSLIGSMSAYGISWDGDLNMWTNGTGHVAAHVTLKAGDEVKFRKDQAWAVNMGGSFSALDTEFEVTQDGSNIVITSDGVYDLYLYPDSNTAKITAAFDPYPEYTEASTWSVIGSIASFDTGWSKDYPMVTDGTVSVALGIVLGDSDEFKFRKDAAWSVNLGGDYAGLGSEFGVSQDGPNIKPGLTGSYDLFVNPDAATAWINDASGLKVSSIIGADEPGPEPDPVTGWNIIGLNGDWENDILATEADGVWTAYITAEGDTEFKWRKDAGWDENYGGVLVALGEPFDAVAGGDNIKISAGFWKVELNLNDLTITVSNGNVWSLIGVNGNWDTDIDMTETEEGLWVSPVTSIEGEFKLRKNHAWDENRGGTLVSLGEAFAAVAGGDNISVPSKGNYIVTYDPSAETIVVDETGWGVVGTINGWGSSPDIILKEEGHFLVAKNVALTADDEIKIRYKNDWDVNRGGETRVGHAVKAVPGGDNIKPGVAGSYDVWYRPDSEVLWVVEAGSTLTYWGVVGTVNNWSDPDFIMYENADGNFVYEGLEITAKDEIKIRVNEDWTENRGGSFAELGTAFSVVNNGDNVKVGADGAVTIVYNPTDETMTVTGDVTVPEVTWPTSITVAGSYSGNGWNIDSDAHLFGKDGVYTGALTMYGGEFKFVSDGSWIGGTADGLTYTLGAGDNMSIADGTYFWNVDLTENKATALAINKVSLIGSFNDWNNDLEMTYNSETYTYSASATFAAGAEVKVRFNGSWDYNLGGNKDALTPGGDNLVIDEAGTYTVVLNLAKTASISFTK